MDKLLIIDGHNLLFQMYFGMPNKILGKNGKYIHGIIGFVGAFIKITQIVQPSHVVVVFDGEHENARKEVNDAYKANRIDYSLVPEEDNPFAQFNDIKRCLKHMDIPFFETIDCEADDLISSYAKKYHQDSQIIISSFDSDFFQLINENVHLFRYKGENSHYITKDDIFAKYGIYPHQYAYFKSMVGDKADNIIGLSKIGVKTAAKIIQEYESLERLLEEYGTMNNEKIKGTIELERQRLIDNHKIITLGSEAQLPFERVHLTFDQKRLYRTNEILKQLDIK